MTTTEKQITRVTSAQIKSAIGYSYAPQTYSNSYSSTRTRICLPGICQETIEDIEVISFTDAIHKGLLEEGIYYSWRFCMDLNKLKINDVALDMLMDKIDSFPGQKHYTRISDGKIDDTLMRGKVFNDSFCEDIYFTGRRRVSNMSHVCTEVVNIYGGCKTYYRSKCIDIVYSLFGDVSWRRVKSRIPVHVGTTDHLIAITDDIPVASINNSYMYDGPASYHV